MIDNKYCLIYKQDDIYYKLEQKFDLINETTNWYLYIYNMNYEEILEEIKKINESKLITNIASNKIDVFMIEK